MSSELCDVDVIYCHHTDEAVLVKVDPRGEGVWVPMSLIEDWDSPSTLEREDDITITLPEWAALEKGLI